MDVKAILSERSTIDQDGCWLWIRGCSGDGYGAIKIAGKQWSAHRLSYATYKGTIPSDMVVMHSCDKPKCINPDHLSIGTVGDNIHDMMNKDRDGFTGSRNRASKLSDRQVDEIRALWGNGNITQRKLADIYGVTYLQIHRIVNHKQRKV